MMYVRNVDCTISRVVYEQQNSNFDSVVLSISHLVLRINVYTFTVVFSLIAVNVWIMYDICNVV